MGGELRPNDPQQLGPYQLIKRLGGGGMGWVYLGQSPHGRLVAVKVIREELAGEREFRARFLREVAAAQKVSSRYTAAVVDVDMYGPVPWLATAYVPGPSLSEAIASYGPLPVASVRALAAGLAEGLGAIHAAGLVHRDLKPSNVLLADDGPRVVDFGLARAVEGEALTLSGMMIGSAGFMAPEQIAGSHVGPPVDLFSLGVVLAFAATGRNPFGDGSTPSILYRLMHGSPDLNGIPPEILDVVRRCLAKDPGERPTAAALLTELSDTHPAEGWLPARVTGKAAATTSAPETSAAEPPAPSALRLHYAVRSDGNIHGVGNQDSAYAGPHVLAVADGKGYHSGKVASAVAIGAMAELDSRNPPGDMLQVLSSAISSASTRLHELIATHPELGGMRTTLTAMLWWQGQAAVCHIGDSRGYLLRNGELHKITHDHTHVQSLIDKGRIPADAALKHPQRSVLLRVLDGKPGVEPDLSAHESQGGDRYLFCSNGLSDVVNDQELQETLAADPETAARQLIELALRGGSRDSITCIVADVVDTTTTERTLPAMKPMLAGAIGQDPDLWTTATSVQAVPSDLSGKPREQTGNTHQPEKPKQSRK
jgi:serine/threonine protein phosphatase PrpC